MALNSFQSSSWVVSKEACHEITKDRRTKKEIKRHLLGALWLQKMDFFQRHKKKTKLKRYQKLVYSGLKGHIAETQEGKESTFCPDLHLEIKTGTEEEERGERNVDTAI